MEGERVNFSLLKVLMMNLQFEHTLQCVPNVRLQVSLARDASHRNINFKNPSSDGGVSVWRFLCKLHNLIFF